MLELLHNYVGIVVMVLAAISLTAALALLLVVIGAGILDLIDRWR